MSSPLDAYLYFHSAVVAEASELATAFEDIVWDDPAEIDDLANRFAFFQEANTVHESAEETFLFPAIEGRLPHVTDAFAFDHTRGERLYGEIARALDDLRTVQRGAPPVDVVREVNHRACALEQLVVLHSDKENELLVPVVTQSFGEDEQRTIMRQMFGHAGPDLGPQIVSWMFGHLSTADRAEFLRVAMQLFPRDRFDAMVGSLAQSVAPQAWSEVLRRMPELTA